MMESDGRAVFSPEERGFKLDANIPRVQVDNTRQAAADFLAEWPNASMDELDEGFPTAGKDRNGLTAILFGTRYPVRDAGRGVVR